MFQQLQQHMYLICYYFFLLTPFSPPSHIDSSVQALILCIVSGFGVLTLVLGNVSAAAATYVYHLLLLL